MTDTPEHAHEFKFDRDAYEARFQRAFLTTLNHRLPEAPPSLAALLADVERLVPPGISELDRFNLRLSALVLAAYQRLSAQLHSTSALEAVQAAFLEPERATMLSGVRAMLDHAPDPFAAMVDVSRGRESRDFGPSFVFERLQDDEHAYLLNIKRCLWHQFFVQHGAPELTPVFCAFDFNWLDAVHPSRDGLRAERATTLGQGHDACRFWFMRTERRG